MHKLRLCFSAIGIFFLAVMSAWGADAPTYSDQIAPLFKKYCNGCHNDQDREGELVLTRYDQLLTGGEHGAVVVAGDSERSRLVQVLTGKAEPRMPPEDNEAPTGDEIALLVGWINAGAKGPDGAEPDPKTLLTPKIPVRGQIVEPISAVACRPGSGQLAVARYGRVELAGSPHRFEDLRGRANAIGFSRDGALLWAAGGEPGLFGELKLWSVDDGALLKTLGGHQDSLYSAALSPDGKLLATAGYDQQIKLWDTASGAELKTLSGHNDAVFDLAFRPDGRVLASASGDRTVKLWDVERGERLDTLGQSLKDIYTVAFSPDGRYVVAGGIDNRIRQWQISADAAENSNPIVYSRFAHEGAIIKLVYSPDGKTLISAGQDRAVKVWDADELRERYALEHQSDWAAAIAVTPDNQTLIIGRLDGTLARFELATGKPITDTRTSRLIPRAADALLGRVSPAITPLLFAAVAADKAATAPPAARPELSGIWPRGAKRGGAARLKFSGKNLADAKEVKTSHAQLAAKIVEAKPDELDVELSPAADLARGRYEVWVVGPGGESAKQVVHVDDLAQAAEPGPNTPSNAASPLAPPVAMWGQLASQGEIDRYQFDAQAGECYVFDVAAAQLGSKVNAVITLSDAAGHVLAAENDFDGSPDPLFAHTFAESGSYTIEISDLLRSGGAGHFYRLSVGPFRFVTGAFPLSIPAGAEKEVELLGFNLPAGARATLPAAGAGETEVPLDDSTYRFRARPKLLVGTLPEVVEQEPNDQPQTANAFAAPGVAGGRIDRAPAGAAEDVDLFRFESRAGEQWIIETTAAQRGSPVDTLLEVLDAAGAPVPRLLLSATRDSNITFQSIDAVTRDCRVTSWEEMQLNEYLYLSGEVVKLFRAPQGPDSGFLFYEGEATKRKNYFDTTAVTHPVDEPCYIVEPHPLGTQLVPNGLPTFTLHYVNDDDSDRRLGTDSRLSLTAPADGGYLVRMRDSRAAGSNRHAYRLVVRHPQPDFNVTLQGAGATIDAGGGKGFTLVVDRVDGFDGEVTVNISGLPPGFHVSTPLVIAAGHREAQGVVWADVDAPAPEKTAAAASVVEASAQVAGQRVVKTAGNLGELKLGAKPPLVVKLEPAELSIAPGGRVQATIRVERNGHDDVVTFAVNNLPHGVIVDSIGLNGVLMPKGENERQIFLSAAPWVAPVERTCFAVAQQVGNQASAPLLLKVANEGVTKEGPERLSEK